MIPATTTEASVEKHAITCPICKNREGWVDVDQFRLKPGGMRLCPKCGFITYPEVVQKAEELKEFYRKEYRPGPTVQNVFTGQRKLNYHANFLDELIQEWKKKKRNADCFEVGAAFGMFLKWWRDHFPKGRVGGSELTLTMRRVAYHEYGLELLEDFDETRKWDLIASYKVLEHIPHPDRELRRYALALKSDGFLYISVPTWFHAMANFGMDGFSLDYYYDKNHVNVWTRRLFETALRAAGLEIVKSNFVYYDATYLCKRNDSLMQSEPSYEKPEEILEAMGRIYKASMAFDQGKFAEALQHYPAYPDAHIANYEGNRAALHKLGFAGIEEQVLKPALATCPETHKISFFCADIAMRYNEIDRAMEYIKRALEQKPGDPGALVALGHCYRALGQKCEKTDFHKAIEYYAQARETMKHLHHCSMQSAHESITWILADAARIPMPSEMGGERAPAS